MDAVKGFIEREGGSIEIRFLDDNAGADFRPFETVISLPEKFGVINAARSTNQPVEVRTPAPNEDAPEVSALCPAV